MRSVYLEATPLAEARAAFERLVAEDCAPLGTESVPLAAACGRVLARAVYAGISSPHYYAAAMDGVAISAEAGFGASPTTPVLLEDPIPVDTGDPLPESTDCVVMVEDLLELDGQPAITTAPTPWQHVRQIGEDICQGEMAFPSYTRLTPAMVAALATCGVLTVEVLKVPLVGVIPTGDEVVPPSAAPGAGEVMETNSLLFAGVLEEHGAKTKVWPIVPDDPEEIQAALGQAAAECDAVILMAGSSKGREDYSAEAIAALGSVLLHGVAVRPGKPVILGQVGAKPAMGAPGYPVSAVVALRELFLPALAVLCHTPVPAPRRAEAVLGRKLNSPLQYEEFVRCRLARIEGRLVAMPTGSGASVVTAFAKSDGLIRVPQNVEFIAPGEKVAVELLADADAIESTVSVVGSHDPLFDELADILAREVPPARLSSAHVGSMGAIQAVKAGQAHCGGIHLLDEETGGYNSSWLRRYFPDGGVKLMRGVGRSQGLMVAPGNPKGIAGVADLANGRLRYVNRQRGAGTRLLLDYLLAGEGIDPADVNGYAREELTHFAVAVQVASGSADAGLGVYAAAKAYGLDFIPVYDEQYDILLSEGFVKDPRFERFYDAFCGPQLKDRLAALGGYTTEGMGGMIEWQN